jgi:hypothetical protein
MTHPSHFPDVHTEHDSAAHAVAPWYWQLTLEPLQVAAHTPVPGQAGRAPTGLPPITAHFPGEPAWLQAWHCPLQRPSQHTPSTQ